MEFGLFMELSVPRPWSADSERESYENALEQVRVFKQMVDVTGLIVTKLDGSARGGVVVALAKEFGLPVHAVGVGEQAGDLRPFAAADYARGLVGTA